MFDEFYLEPRQTAATAGITSPDAAVADDKSVAVLPFRSMSSGEDDEYFADGLTEEILNALAALDELLVTARTSSFHFKDKDLPVTEIGATLGVAHIVEGSVRRAGEEVRITAQLVRTTDGFHLWSQTYDRTLEDVFAVQEDIAANITAALDVLLDDAQVQQMRAAGIGNVEAFIAMQKADHISVIAHKVVDYHELAEANRWYDRALELVPDLTEAHLLRTDSPPAHDQRGPGARFRDHRTGDVRTRRQDSCRLAAGTADCTDRGAARGHRRRTDIAQ